MLEAYSSNEAGILMIRCALLLLGRQLFVSDSGLLTRFVVISSKVALVSIVMISGRRGAFVDDIY